MIKWVLCAENTRLLPHIGNLFRIEPSATVLMRAILIMALFAVEEVLVSAEHV